MPQRWASSKWDSPLNVCFCLNTPKQQTRQSRPSSAEMALLTSTTMRTCARPAAAPRAVVVTPRVVVCRAKTQEEALKAAGDLLQKGVAMATDAVKNVDTAQLKAQAQQAAQMSAATVKAAIDAGLKAWSKYDKDEDGKLSIAEAVELLNGPEISAAIKQATGMEHSKRSEADIKKWFERADFDHSGTLSKREFAVMYAGVLCEKAAGSATTMSNGLLQAIVAAGGDGKIEVSELKNLLGLVGLRKA